METKTVSRSIYWARILLLGMLQPVIYYVPYMYYYLGNQMTDHFQTDLVTIASFIGLYGLICLFLYIPAGIFTDIVGAKKSLVFSLLSTALLLVWYGVTKSVGTIKIITILLAITTVFTFWSSWLVAVAQAGTKEEQGKSFAYAYTIVALGNILVGFMATGIVGNNPDRIPLLVYILAILHVLSAIGCFFLIPGKIKSDNKDDAFKASDLLEVIKTPGVWCVSLVVFAFYSTLATTNTFNQLLSEGYGMTDAQASFIAVFRANGLGLIAGPILAYFGVKAKSNAFIIRIAVVVEIALIIAMILTPINHSLLFAVIAMVLAIAFLQLGVRGVYWGQMSEALIPNHILGTATGVISILAYSADTFIHTLTAKMITLPDGSWNPDGYFQLHILQIVLLTVAFFATTFIIRISKKHNASKVEA